MPSMGDESAVRVAFIGGGNMARALIGGLLRQGVAPQLLSAGEPEAAARASLEREFGIRATADNAEALQGAAVAVLAVKPQVAPQALRPLKTVLAANHPVMLSIMAGVRLADLARLCPASLPIVRAMPNRPALVGAGITALHAPPSVTAAQRALVAFVARAAGRIVWVDAERELDVVTALSASGPAYFFLLAEQMARAAIDLGLPRETALLLAAETLHGSGALMRAAGSLEEQRAAVTSRGGTTEAALSVLEAGGFNALIARALRAAAARSAELAGQASAAPGSPAGAPGA